MLTLNQGSTRYERVSQLINSKLYNQAIAAAEKWIESNPHNADAYAMLSQVYLKSGSLQDALHWSEEALRYDAENSIAWFVRVVVLYAQGDEIEFLQAVHEAQRIDPYESHYYFLKFNACHKKGRIQQARDQLNKALYMCPDNSTYIAADSYLLANCGLFEASRCSESKALRHNPEDDQTFLYLAWAAEARGDYDKQLEYLENALRIDPDDPQIRSEYLNSLRKNNRLYRILLAPPLLRRLKAWQFALIAIAAWFIFKPLTLLLIVLYFFSNGLSVIVIRAHLFGWKSMFPQMK